MARSELERHVGELSALLDHVNCGLIATDPDGDLVFVNTPMREWLGYELEEIVGRPSTDLVPEELRSQIEVERLAAQRGDIRARLVVIQRKNSTTFPAIVLPRAFFGEAGGFEGALLVVVELATIQTAKPVGNEFGTDIRAELQRIAMLIQSIGLAAGTAVRRVPLEHPALSELTERERVVLTHLLSGARVPTIAKKLFISPHTVRNHLKGVFRKVGVANQSELIERVQEIASDTRPR
jgi:PAS domain S-box-containing protein